MCSHSKKSNRKLFSYKSACLKSYIEEIKTYCIITWCILLYYRYKNNLIDGKCQESSDKQQDVQQSIVSYWCKPDHY